MSDLPPFLNISKKEEDRSSSSPSPPPTYFDSYLDDITTDKAKQEITGLLVNSRHLDTEDDIYFITNTIASVEKLMEYLDRLYSSVPKMLERVWDEERVKRDEEVTKRAIAGDEAAKRAKEQLTELQNLAKQSIARSGNNINKKLERACLLLGGCIGGLLLAHFCLLPRELELARGGDSIFIEWAKNTDDGKIFYRAFKSGNRSIRDCVQKSSSKKKGKISCIIELI